MSALPVLEVAIGLSFVYLLLALMTTTLTEWVSRMREGRCRMLEDGVRCLLGEQGSKTGLWQPLMNHPLIRTTGRKGSRPSYISSEIFVRAFMDVVSRPPGSTPMVFLDEGDTPKISDAKPTQRLRHSLTALSLAPAGTEAVVIKDSPENMRLLGQWYEQHMERVSGWYKRRAQVVVLIVSIAITLGLNVDSLRIAKHLWSDSALRATIVEAAKARIAMGPPLETVEYSDPTNPEPTAPIEETKTEESSDGGPNSLSGHEQELLAGLTGWSGEREREKQLGWGRWLLYHLPGWIITALAISLGAPFWFDTLSRFVRATGAPPPKASTQSAART